MISSGLRCVTVKAVIERSLEQQAILAIGWLRKAGRIAAEKKIAAEELPQGLQQKPREYAKTQAALAHKSVEKLTAQVSEISDRASAAIKTLQQQSAELATAAGVGKKSVWEANKEAQALAVQIEGARAAMDQTTRLLRILHGQEELPLPTLPLYQYAEALERLEGAGEEASVLNTEKQQRNAAQGRVTAMFLRKTDRSDRVALGIALILCITVIATALYYVFFAGGIDIKITPLPGAGLQVQCVNTKYDSIMLHVPYGGDKLPENPLPQYGLLLELIDEEGNNIRPSALETRWEYKDVPAHLYGPIVVGPLFAVELSLDLNNYTHNSDIRAVRLTLCRAPSRQGKTFEVVLPSNFWEQEYNQKPGIS